MKTKTKNKGYVPYEQYLKREQELNQIQEQGIKFIFKKNWFKLIGGIALIGVGVITLTLPTGSIFLIAGGFYLLGLSTSDLFRYKDILIKKLKVKLRRWFRK